MTYTYEVYTEDGGESWYLKADGVLVSDTDKGVLVKIAMEMIAAIAQLGFHSQLVVREPNGEVSYKANV